MTRVLARPAVVACLLVSVGLFAVLSAKRATAQDPTATVTLSAFPKDLQLYPRNADNVGTVAIAGAVTSGVAETLRVDVVRNGDLVTSVVHDVATSAEFSLPVTITAELADYTISLYTVSGEQDTLQARASRVVAGDAFVVQGQSNAVARMYTQDDDENDDFYAYYVSAETAQNDFVRSYGSRVDDAALVQQDSAWHVADGDSNLTSAAVGQWALAMADQIARNHGIPIAIINGGYPGMPISYFQSNDEHPRDLDTNYGRLLYRLEQAGLSDSVKGLFWYQGESDEGNVAAHVEGFDALYQDWKRDLPSISNLYVFQIADACTEANLALRDAQRRMANRYPDVTVLSTNSIKGHRKDCHYWFQDGYATLGDWAARVLARDHYGVDDVSAEPPNISHAYFSNDARTEVTLQLTNVAEGFTFDDLRDERGEGYTALYRFGFRSSRDNEEIQHEIKRIDQTNGKLVFAIQTGFSRTQGARPPRGDVTAFYQGDPWLLIGTEEADYDNVSNVHGMGLLAFEMPVVSSEDVPADIVDALDKNNTLLGDFALESAPTARLRAESQNAFTMIDGEFTVLLSSHLSSDPNNDIVRYDWSLGNGDSITNAATTRYTYDESGTYELTLTVTDQEGNSNTTSQMLSVWLDTQDACPDHGLRFDRFDDIDGRSVADLIEADPFDAASEQQTLRHFELPENVADAYGGRIYGYIVAPVSGTYEFWLTSDDESQLWIYSMVDRDSAEFSPPPLSETLTLSPTLSVTELSQPPRQFDRRRTPSDAGQATTTDAFIPNTTFTKTLEAGKQYYVEALFKEGAGSDHLSLAWMPPGTNDFMLVEEPHLCLPIEDQVETLALPEVDRVRTGAADAINKPTAIQLTLISIAGGTLLAAAGAGLYRLIDPQ